MKVFFSFGFMVRTAILCLLAGMGVGLYLGASAVSPDRPVGVIAVSAHPPATAWAVHPGREVTTWSHTSTSSFCSGC